MATGFTSFREFSAGSLPADFTLVETNDGATNDVTVENVAGSLSGKALKIANTTGGNYRGGVFWDAVTPFADGEVTALVRIPTWVSTELPYVGAAGRGTYTGTPSVTMVGAKTDNRLDRVVLGYGNASTNDPLSGFLTSDSVTQGDDERWWLRVNFNGTAYKVKMWQVGTPEPAAWNIETTSATPTTSSGVPCIPFNIQSGEDFGYCEAIGWSDDPSISAPIYDFSLHDATTVDAGSGTYNHTRGALTNGVAVLRRWDPNANLSTSPVPTYDGNNMTLAVSQQRVDIWYYLLGSVSGGTHTVDPQGTMDSALSTYDGVDQSDPIRDSDSWQNNEPDYPAAGQGGVPVDSSTLGDVVVDAFVSIGGTTSTVTHDNPESKAVRELDSSYAAGGDIGSHAIGDTLSVTAATNMYYGYTLSGNPKIAWLAAVSFRAALPTFTPTFTLFSEHNAQVIARFFLFSEHLRALVEEIVNRKRLFSDVGQDVRSLEIEV